MKKYMKPIMDSEVFVTSEYIGACLEGIGCLNMGVDADAAKNIKVYNDNNNLGTLDADEMNYDNLYTNWDYSDDCGRTGDITGNNHNLTGVDLSTLKRVIVCYDDDDSKTGYERMIPAYVSFDLNKNNSQKHPHFISVKTTNAS